MWVRAFGTKPQAHIPVESKLPPQRGRWVLKWSPSHWGKNKTAESELSCQCELSLTCQLVPKCESSSLFIAYTLCSLAYRTHERVWNSSIGFEMQARSMATISPNFHLCTVDYDLNSVVFLLNSKFQIAIAQRGHKVVLWNILYQVHWCLASFYNLSHHTIRISI